MKDIKQKYDLILLTQIRAGNEYAFKKLVNKYKSYVSAVIFGMVNNTMDAEDLTQEVFIKVYSSIQSYVPTYTFRTWLFSIVRNHTLDFLKRQRLKYYDLDTAYMVRSYEYTPEQLLIQAENEMLLKRSLDSLNPIYRKVHELQTVEGMSCGEIAQALGLPLNTVCGQLKRAKAELYKFILKN